MNLEQIEAIIAKNLTITDQRLMDGVIGAVLDAIAAEREAGPKPDYYCIAALDAARARAWKDRNTRCGCDHNELCAECFPPAFHTGGYWDQQRALLQQSTALPERGELRNEQTN